MNLSERIVTMKKNDEKENLSEIIKMRVTPIQKNAIELTASEQNCSVSCALRKAVFDKASSYVAKIQRNLDKNQVHNMITSMKIPKKYKDQILKELSTID